MAPTACRHRVSETFHPPTWGTFHLSLTLLFTIGYNMYLVLGNGLPCFIQGITVPVLLRSTPSIQTAISSTGLSPSLVRLSIRFFFNYLATCFLLGKQRCYHNTVSGTSQDLRINGTILSQREITAHLTLHQISLDFIRFRSPLLTESPTFT